MRLKPFFSYYGSKWTIIENYPIPTTETIIEPFAGSSQYALRYPYKNVYLYDLDENIVQIWDYLINVSEKEILSLDLNFKHIDDSKLTEIQKILVGFWIAQGGTYPKKSKTQFSIDNNLNWPYRVASQLQYIRHWKIQHCSYADIPDHCGTWFIDPPYIDKGIFYRRSSRSIDYDHLAKWSTERLHEYIVCENLGANWLPFVSLCNLVNNKAQQTKEAIYTNMQQQLSLF